MDVKLELRKLQQNRLLRNSNEVHAFELAIENIVSLKDVNFVKDLCSGFDDQTEDHEIMFGLIHAIEDVEGEEGLFEMAKAIPSMLQHAKEWATILHYRILNHEISRKLYVKVLLRVDPTVKETIIGIIKEIKDEDPTRFGNSANEILTNVQ